MKLYDCKNIFEFIKEQLFSKFEIKQWLENEKVISFNLDDYKYDICHKKIPLWFKVSGKIYNLLEFENMNYIVLEYLGKTDKNSNENASEKIMKIKG